jgi:di/tricarboxylate transporter
MAAAALLGAVMSSTAVVAIFIPIVLRIASETNLNASRMLMPMSYAALISGMLTLIATTPNLVVHEELQAAGFDGFGFFSFAPVGLAVLVVAIVYILFGGRMMLPGGMQESTGERRKRSTLELWEDYRVHREHGYVQISPESPLAEKTIAESGLEDDYGVSVLGILRSERSNEERIAAPVPSTELRARDILITTGLPENHERLTAEQILKPYPATQRDRQRWFWEMGGAVVLIHPESGLLGKSVREIGFRTNFGLQVLGIRRDREPVADYRELKLARSDSLLVLGPWSRLKKLQSQHHDFVVLEMPTEHEEVVPAYRRMPVSLVILAAMVLLTMFDLVPLVAAVIMAALAAVYTRCLTMEDSYRSIHWSSIVLVAGMLPLADALNKTGGTQFVVDTLMQGLGDSGPRMMLTVIFFLTAALGLFLSNTASAVLVAPIAIIAAKTLGVSPYPFAVAVLIAASAAFVTPVSTPVVTLVVEPGRYKFTDFVKVGVPLLLLTYLTTLLVAPLIFPFGG